MANIMSQLKLSNNTSRNAFDLGRKNAFTAKIGELLPVCCIECIPGDKIKGRVQHFTRTMPVNTAAYTRIREYYDWFFVPTNLLWNKFNTFVTQMVDNNQHATSITGSQVLTTQHPYFTTNQVASYIQSMSGSGADTFNIFNYNRAKLTAKLMHYLGYGDFFQSAQGTAQSFRTNANLNPFPLLAYQKIYQDYFRNSQWENAYAPAFNIDYISGAADSLNIPVSSLTSQSRTIENMFDLRYTNWNKDKFMGLLPNAQYGDAASIMLGGNSGSEGDTTNFTRFFNIAADTTNAQNVQMLNMSSFDTGISGFPYLGNLEGANGGSMQDFWRASHVQELKEAMGLSTGSMAASFSILALRQAEALQKWKEITQSQQQDYKNQIEAHFGVSMSDAYSERCKYVDGSVSSLDISEVTNTNLADNNAAEIAGKGVGVGDGSINFSSDVHGYLMCIYHAVPLLDYALDGVNRMNLKTMVTDYAIPEFDKTGMVQVPFIELSNSPNNPTFTAELLGYAPRYYDYKTSIDEVHGAFYNGGSQLENWVAPIDTTYITKYVEAMHGDGSSISYQWFKVNPAVLNPIFQVQVSNDYTNNPTGTYDDQLLINAAFDITAVRNLDRNGLPY